MHFKSVLVCCLFVAPLTAQTNPSACTDCGTSAPAARSAEYKSLIEPLLSVTDFRTHYYDDGAADATVTCPRDCDVPVTKPVREVEALMKNPSKTVPLLINCLDDGRVTSVTFDGNTTTRPMKVPIGYVCLDILLQRFVSEPISEYECNSDGLGACVNTPFYFRPDDYTHCWKDRCEPRPWVLVVKHRWLKELQSGILWRAQRHPKSNPN
jgi:hypothetical protein